METMALRGGFVSSGNWPPVRWKILVFWEKTGAGEGIRTLDPNLGKVVLYP